MRVDVLRLLDLAGDADAVLLRVLRDGVTMLGEVEPAASTPDGDAWEEDAWSVAGLAFLKGDTAPRMEDHSLAAGWRLGGADQAVSRRAIVAEVQQAAKAGC